MHRRMKHGVGTTVEPSEMMSPPSLLPTRPGPSSAALDELTLLVRRLEQRVEALEGHAVERAEAAAAFSAEAEHLRLELDDVMLHIAALSQGPTERRETNDEMGVRHRELGKLRRRQAELLYRLDPTGSRSFVDDAF